MPGDIIVIRCNREELKKLAEKAKNKKKNPPKPMKKQRRKKNVKK